MPKLLSSLILAAFFTFVTVAPSLATAATASISHSYKSGQTIPNGSIVSLEKNRAGYIELASRDTEQRLIGVSSASSESLVALDQDDTETQVITSGKASVLASTLNGDIKVGDEVTASPLKGIGMLAQAGSQVIGVAQSTLTKSTQSTSTRQVIDKYGVKKTIIVGKVALDIQVRPSAIKINNTTGSLQQFANDISGHTVSKVRVIVSTVIAIIGALSLLALVASSIYAAIVSIGRNPLAKHQIQRTLIQVSGMALGTATVVVLTLYILLR